MDARKRESESNLALAYHVEVFARQKRLKGLDHYLNTPKPDATRGAANLLGTLKALQKKGVPMKIEKIQRDRK